MIECHSKISNFINDFVDSNNVLEDKFNLKGILVNSIVDMMLN